MIKNQRMGRLSALVSGCALLLAAAGAGAQDAVRKDVLLIDRMAKTAHMSVPVNGLTMDEVVQKFGEPANRYGAVGDPPIARWIYDNFTVYFEYQRVIHSVINRATQSETAPPQN
ncbi:MAG: hypothetical protein AAGB27_05430 [Pseudomonadota bacterium]